MPITVECPGCGKRFANVAESKIGSTVRCGCGENFQIQAEAEYAQAEEFLSANRPKQPKQPKTRAQAPSEATVVINTEQESGAYLPPKKSMGPLLIGVGLGVSAIAALVVFLVVGMGGDDEDEKTADNKQKAKPVNEVKQEEKQIVKTAPLDYLHVLTDQRVANALNLTPGQQEDLQKISQVHQLDLRALFVDAALEKIKGNVQPGHQVVELTDAEKQTLLQGHLNKVAPQVRGVLTRLQRAKFEEMIAQGDLPKLSVTPQGTLNGANLMAAFSPVDFPQPNIPDDPNPKPPVEVKPPPEENNPPDSNELPPLVLPEVEPGVNDSAELIAARKKHSQLVGQAITNLDDTLTALHTKATDLGHDDRAEELFQIHRRFRIARTIPTLDVLESFVAEYHKTIREADRQLVVALQKDIKELTKQLKIDEATELQSETDLLIARSGQPDANTPPPADDRVAKTLKQAQEKHEQAVQDAKTQVLEAFDSEIKTVAGTGDLAGVKRLQEQKQGFESDGSFDGEVSDAIKTANTKYLIDARRADTQLENAYKNAIIQYQKDKQTQLAKDLQDELDSGVGVEGKRWYVLFRSLDPSVWNQYARSPGRFANPAGSAPEGVRYLRMRLMERRPQTVIIPMTKLRLTKVSAINTLGWNGENKKERGGHHLGIYRTDTMLKFPVPDKFKGAVSVYDRGWDAHLGWGFGHHIKVDKQQGFSWKGNPIKPTMIEIAVTTLPLLEEDRRLLLEDPRINTLVPTSEEQAQIWKFTTSKPAGDWQAEDYDDSLWQSERGAFGTQRDYFFARTEWDSDDIWLRREFTRTASENKIRIKNPHLRINHDEDAEVYLNGEIIATLPKSSNKKYIFVPIQGNLKFKDGKNVLAVHCHDRSFAQYIDVGIVDLKGDFKTPN